MKRTFLMAALLVSLILSTFVVNATEPFVVADGATAVVATVVSVDEKNRDVTLVGPEGDEWTVTAGPEVRNFAQIKRGDRIIASYFEGFAIDIGPKGSGVKDRVDSMGVSRAKKGEKPGAMVSKTVLAVGVVKEVNAKNRIVVLEGPKHTLALGVDPDVDISKIEVGGEAEAVYIESFALNMIPAPEVSATVTLESTAIAVGIGVTWGHGVMTMHDGTVHKFKVKGLSLVDLGVTKISATGEVFNLVEAKDLNGTFATGEAGATLFKGGSISAMQNENLVVMQLKSSQKGVRLTVAPGGLGVKLVE